MTGTAAKRTSTAALRLEAETMKFLREDNEVTYCGEDPIDRNDPEGAKDAVEMTLPTGFSEKA